MNNVEYSIYSSKYVSIHISHRSYLTPQNGTSNITLTDPLMKAVFNRRKKIGSLEQEYSSGSVEWPVERPSISLRTARRRFLRPASYTTCEPLLITGPPRVADLSLTGEPHRTKLEVVPCGSGPKFRIKTDVLLQLYIK